MYFLFVSNETYDIALFRNALSSLPEERKLIAVNDGFEALHFLQNIKRGETFPDLIIFSIKINRVNGIELLELLKTDDLYRVIPICMILTLDQEESRSYCEKLGADTMETPTKQSEWNMAAERMTAALN
jgi:CheY-like chemotaxis protein